MDALDTKNGMTLGELRELLSDVAYPDSTVLVVRHAGQSDRVTAADVWEISARVNSIAGPSESSWELRLQLADWQSGA